MDISDRQSQLRALLDRPADQRLREYKYRCAQSIVFGVPVVALQWFGHRLGGPEAERWVAILQALLAGWVVYVGAAGMLFEGLVRQRVSGDLVVAVVAIGVYLLSVASLLALVVGGRLWFRPLLFHVAVLVLAVWTGIQWTRFAGQRDAR